jgi:cytochrome b561
MNGKLHALRRLLHWAVAFLVIVMIPAGLIFTDPDNKTTLEALFGEGSSGSLYDMHKSVGVLILALMAARVGAKLVWPDPAHEPPLPGAERVVSRAAHGALYVLLIGVPLLGWAGTTAFPAPVPVFGLFQLPAIAPADKELSEYLLRLHSLGAYLLASIAVIHVSGAIWHKAVRTDSVYHRISFLARRPDA